MKYVDIRGTERGPFELVFDPKVEQIRSGKQILTQLPHAWLSFRLYDGRLLAYFTHLQSYRYALTEIRYSVDADTLDQILPLGSLDPSNPHAVSDDAVTYLAVPGETRFISVQLKFGDGTKSKLQRFDYHGARPQAVPEQVNVAPAPNHTVSPPAAGQHPRGNSPLELNIDPTFRRAPRVRFGFGF